MGERGGEGSVGERGEGERGERGELGELGERVTRGEGPGGVEERRGDSREVPASGRREGGSWVSFCFVFFMD